MGITKPRVLHPALVARAAAVKAAHAHLAATVPGFKLKSGAEQIAHVQRHVTKTLKRGGY